MWGITKTPVDFGAGASEPEADPGSILLVDADGAYLLDDDGAYLQEPE